MLRIAIVGGGQAGLPLAFGLLDGGYEVTVVSNRTPDALRVEPLLDARRALCVADDLKGQSFDSIENGRLGGCTAFTWPTTSIRLRAHFSRGIIAALMTPGPLRAPL